MGCLILPDHYNYTFFDEKENEIFGNFTNKIKNDFSNNVIEVENIKSGTYIQGNFKFVFSTSTGERGEDHDIFTIYQDNKEVKNITGWRLEGLTKIKYGGVDYYSLADYSGGAHCCFADYPMVIKNNTITYGGGGTFGNATGLRDDHLFVKNNKLYFYTYDDRFSYFHTSFAQSGIMWFPKFYLFDAVSGDYLEASSEFRSYYLDIAEDIENGLKQIDDLYNSELSAQDRLPFLVAKATHKLLGGESVDAVKQSFVVDYLRNKTIFIDDGTEGLSDTSENIWDEIISKLGL